MRNSPSAIASSLALIKPREPKHRLSVPKTTGTFTIWVGSVDTEKVQDHNDGRTRAIFLRKRFANASEKVGKGLSESRDENSLRIGD